MIYNDVSFKSIPAIVKAGIGLMLGGWVTFLSGIWFFYGKEFFQKFFIAGIVTCFCITLFKNWARILALLSNTIIAIYCTFFAILFYQSQANPLSVVVSACTVALLISSSLFLLNKDGVAFFKAHSKTAEQNQQSAPAEAPAPPTKKRRK